MRAEIQRKTDLTETAPKFFEPGGILFRELEWLESEDLAFKTARYVSQIPEDKLRSEVVPMIEGLAIVDNTFAMHDGQNFMPLRGRDPDEKNAQFKDYVSKILQNWGSDLPPETRTSLSSKEIVEFTEGLGFREELAFRLYRIRQFSSLHKSYGEVTKDSTWEEISKGLEHGAVICLLAMRYITQ